MDPPLGLSGATPVCCLRPLGDWWCVFAFPFLSLWELFISGYRRGMGSVRGSELGSRSVGTSSSQRRDSIHLWGSQSLKWSRRFGHKTTDVGSRTQAPLKPEVNCWQILDESLLLNLNVFICKMGQLGHKMSLNLKSTDCILNLNKGQDHAQSLLLLRFEPVPVP